MQTGSHIRLTKTDEKIHHITVPNHAPIKIGTLNQIITDICKENDIDKDEFISKLQ